MEILIFIGLVVLYYWYIISKDSRKEEQERIEKAKKEALNKRNLLVRKAENLFVQKKYDEALKIFKEANNETPSYDKNSHITLHIALCNFYLKDYESALSHSKYINNDDAYRCKAISYFELGDYSKSKEVFKEGIQKKYPQVTQAYNIYFNPQKNKLVYWNSLEENAKILLARNAKINYNFQLTENDIDLIVSCKELDLSCRKEEWQWYGHKGWVIFVKNNKNEITNLEFCKYIPNIKKLNISGQKITNFDGLENQINLIEINASHSLITDITALRTCNKLQNLNLCYANFPKMVSAIDLFPITKISLIKLDLSCCYIKNIELLNCIKTLKELSLFRTKIISLSQIKDLTMLEILCVAGSENFKLSTECNLHNLKLLGCTCSKVEIDLFKLKFPNCKVKNDYSNIDIFNKKPNYDVDKQDLLAAKYDYLKDIL